VGLADAGGVYQGPIAREWVVRPDFAASDWPAHHLHGHSLPLPLAVRVMNARNVVGHLTLVTPEGLLMQVDDGARHVPFGIVRAYAVLHELTDRSDSLGR